MQWSIGIVNLISNDWRSLTLEKYMSSGPLVQLVLSKIQSKVNGQTINYCITISMQKSSSIHHFILETQHKYFAHFWPYLPKTFRSKFYLPEFVSTFQKSVYSFHLFFRYSQCWSPVSRVLKPTRPYRPKSFSINFQF